MISEPCLQGFHPGGKFCLACRAGRANRKSLLIFDRREQKPSPATGISLSIGAAIGNS